VTKVRLEQIECSDLINAVDRATDNAWKNFRYTPAGLCRIAYPQEWFNDGTTAGSIEGAARCNGCGGRCEKTAKVHINFLESRIVYAETYPQYDETRVKVFNSGGRRSISIHVSGHPCPK